MNILLSLSLDGLQMSVVQFVAFYLQRKGTYRWGRSHPISDLQGRGVVYSNGLRYDRITSEAMFNDSLYLVRMELVAWASDRVNHFACQWDFEGEFVFSCRQLERAEGL